MKVQRVRLPNTDQIRWIVLDDEFVPIQPICSYLTFLGDLDRSPNTIRATAHHLKLFWQYLGDEQITWTEVVKGDARANDPEVQLVRKGIRGQTLPIGGCGRLIVLGECNYANKCVTCPMWLTSTDDVPALKSFHERAVRLRQRAQDVGNQVVVQQQTHIITNLTVRLKSLEEPKGDGTLDLDEMLAQLRTDLAEARAGLEEAQTAGLLLAAKHLERVISELKARLAALEGKNQ